MIYKLKVSDVTNAICHWWGDVEWLKGRQEIEFGPGLNILFGKNGSGKSTVLTTIAKLLCCYDGDQQLVGQHTSHDLHDGHGDGKTLKLGVEPIHDGSPIIHFDPSQKVGLIGGGFDWDFGDAGLRNTMFKGSAGQTCMMRMNQALAIAFGKVEWPEVTWKGTRAEFSPLLATFFKGDGNRVRPTLLMDEPSSNLDLRTEILLFKALQRIADSGVQVIVATHSVFALHMAGAKYIDTTPGYSTHAKIDVEAHFLEALMRSPKRLKLMMEYVETTSETKVGLVIGTKGAKAIAKGRRATTKLHLRADCRRLKGDDLEALEGTVKTDGPNVVATVNGNEAGTVCADCVKWAEAPTC